MLPVSVFNFSQFTWLQLWESKSCDPRLSNRFAKILKNFAMREDEEVAKENRLGGWVKSLKLSELGTFFVNKRIVADFYS